MAARTGLKALLDPAQGVLLLIDHQPVSLGACGCRRAKAVLGAADALARGARLLGVPIVATTFLARRRGALDAALAVLAAGEGAIDRAVVNAWEDPALAAAVKATGRRQLVVAGLGSDAALAMTALDARSEGFDVFIVADACGAADQERHDLAIARMIQAEVAPVSWRGVLAEWQRDWSRPTAAAVDEILGET